MIVINYNVKTHVFIKIKEHILRSEKWTNISIGKILSKKVAYPNLSRNILLHNAPS